MNCPEQHPEARVPLVPLADVQAAEAELRGPRLQHLAAQESALLLLHPRQAARSGMELTLQGDHSAWLQPSVDLDLGSSAILPGQ